MQTKLAVGSHYSELMPVERLQQSFAALEPHTQAWALVGFYFQQFAMLERVIDDTITEVLGIGLMPLFAINRNLDISAKVNILRSLVSLVYHTPSDPEMADRWASSRDAVVKVLNTIRRPHLEDRNMIAHCSFGPRAIGQNGVLFRQVKATSKLEINSVHWTIEMFLDKAGEIESMFPVLQSYGDHAEEGGFHQVAHAKTIEALFAVQRP